MTDPEGATADERVVALERRVGRLGCALYGFMGVAASALFVDWPGMLREVVADYPVLGFLAGVLVFVAALVAGMETMRRVGSPR